MKTPSILIVLALLACSPCFAKDKSKQGVSASGPNLGPHQIAGRGCVACHAPHRSQSGPVAAKVNGEVLWSPDLGPVYGTNTGSVHGSAQNVSVPSAATNEKPNASINKCLNCHDDNIAGSGLPSERRKP